jgi:glycosyltransferase involved in cell wall biosynthesis
MNKSEINRIVREILKEKGLLTDPDQLSGRCLKKSPDGPAVLFVFHSGVRYLKKALIQVQQIDETTCRSSVFTSKPAREWVCGVDVQTQAGIRCCLDKVKPNGIEKTLKKSDILVLPTFCLKTAAKIASFGADTIESAIVLSALAQGKKVLATRDGFSLLNTLVNGGIRKEMDRILSKLEGFGMTFCNTDDLAVAFGNIMESQRGPSSKKQEKVSGSQASDGLKLVTAKEIQRAVNYKQTSVLMAAGGIVTPLAKDQAREYAIKIVLNDSTDTGDK